VFIIQSGNMLRELTSQNLQGFVVFWPNDISKVAIMSVSWKDGWNSLGAAGYAELTGGSVIDPNQSSSRPTL
jgi:hypothetical protein